MLHGVRLWILGAIASAALTTLAGCGHNFYSGEREACGRDWLFLGTTKTGLVYRLKGNPPQSHE